MPKKKIAKKKDAIPERFMVTMSDIPETIGLCILQDAVEIGTTYGNAAKSALLAHYKSQNRI